MKLKISNLLSGRAEAPEKALSSPTAFNNTLPRQDVTSKPKDENINTNNVLNTSTLTETPILASGASTALENSASSAQHRKSASNAPGRRPSKSPATVPVVDKKERMAALMARNPTSWSVKEVCDWLEAVGLGRHRKAFVHHSLSGALLPKISTETLKEDLGIKSLGQRETLLSAIQELLTKARARDEIISGSVLLSATAISASPAPVAVIPVPGSELLKAQEQCARLKRDLEKAETRAVNLQAAAEQAQRVSDLAQREVERLQDMVKKAELQCSPLRGKAAILAGLPSPKLITEENAKVKLQAASAAFMQRLQSDMDARKAKLRQGRAQAGRARSQSEKEGETLASCLELIQAEIGDKDPALKLSLKPDEQEDKLIEALHDAAAALTETLGLTAGDLSGVKAALGPEKKAQRLASGIKTALFMRRLEQDISTRDDRKKELRQRWAAQRAERAAAKESRDMTEAKMRFRALGWPEIVGGGEGAWDELLSGLVNRGKIAGKAKADGKPADWEQCRSDGLLAYGVSEDTVDPSTQPTTASESGGPPDFSLGTGTGATSSTSLPSSAAGNSLLLSNVDLLGCCRGEELDRLLTVSGAKRVLAVHRALKTQEFLKETKADLDARAAKLEDVQISEKPKRGKKLAKEAQTAFLERLAEDAARRNRNRDELQAKAREAEKVASAPVKGPSIKRNKSGDAGGSKGGE